MGTTDRILIIGACGQIGTELTEALQKLHGIENVVATDLKSSPALPAGTIFEELDALDKERIFEVVKKYKITQVYLLAALLSATAEKNPSFAWKLNMESLFHVLDLAKEKHIQKVYWPSSIAVFGPNTPKKNTPQYTIMEPSTVYGISKLAGERWCEYYFHKFGVDVRSLRYPGLISWKSAPGGGTTDYAIHIFHEALKSGSYSCFLSENTELPMMYMDDAIKATVDIMQVSAEKIKIRSSYNLAAISFSPKQIAEEIKKHIPDFSINYSVDFRQEIADSWPAHIDDSMARQDWGWKHRSDLPEIVSEMLRNLRKIILHHSL
jgi:nucleoside-diphosphate-sugar epimerase